MIQEQYMPLKEQKMYYAQVMSTYGCEVYFKAAREANAEADRLGKRHPQMGAICKHILETIAPPEAVRKCETITMGAPNITRAGQLIARAIDNKKRVHPDMTIVSPIQYIRYPGEVVASVTIEISVVEKYR